jgi:hypothetical protein
MLSCPRTLRGATRQTSRRVGTSLLSISSCVAGGWRVHQLNSLLCCCCSLSCNECIQALIQLENRIIRGRGKGCAAVCDVAGGEQRTWSVRCGKGLGRLHIPRWSDGNLAGPSAAGSLDSLSAILTSCGQGTLRKAHSYLLM